MFAEAAPTAFCAFIAQSVVLTEVVPAAVFAHISPPVMLTDATPAALFAIIPPFVVRAYPHTPAFPALVPPPVVGAFIILSRWRSFNDSAFHEGVMYSTQGFRTSNLYIYGEKVYQ